MYKIQCTTSTGETSLLTWQCGPQVSSIVQNLALNQDAVLIRVKDMSAHCPVDAEQVMMRLRKGLPWIIPIPTGCPDTAFRDWIPPGPKPSRKVYKAVAKEEKCAGLLGA